MIKKYAINFIQIMSITFAFFILFSFEKKDINFINAAYVCVNDKAQLLPQYTTNTTCKAVSGNEWVDDTNVKIYCYQRYDVYQKKSNNALDYVYKRIDCGSVSAKFQRTINKLGVTKTVNLYPTVFSGSTELTNGDLCNEISDGCYTASNQNSTTVPYHIYFIDSSDLVSCYDEDGIIKDCSNTNVSANSTNSGGKIIAVAKSCYDIDGNLISCNYMNETQLSNAGVSDYGSNCLSSTATLIACEGSNLDETIKTIQEIIDGFILPIIWLALGSLLVIKGAILGAQIVKAADEPQIRQEKIKSLKYLIIGVAVAYGISFAADNLFSFFESFIK